jgi:hypothetical protein
MSGKMIQILVMLTVIPMMAACSQFVSTPVPSQQDIEAEEQAVYAFFVSRAEGSTVILQETSTGFPTDDPKQTRDSMRFNFPRLSAQAVDTFMERNQGPTQLSPNMQLGVDYTLLSAKDLATISSQPNWHEILRDKYPGSNGYLIFSRVGFNSSLDQAVIYVGQVAGPLMGSGSYYLMEKQNGEWILKDQVMVWIS